MKNGKYNIWDLLTDIRFILSLIIIIIIILYKLGVLKPG